MTYRIAIRMPYGLQLPDQAGLARACRRLYAEKDRRHLRQDAERSLGWLGLLLCLAGGFLELDCLKWALG